MSRTEDDVTDIRENHSFDVKKLEAYLIQEKLPGFKAPLTIKQFGHGQSNPTFLLESATGLRYVLRKQPPGKLISKTAHRVDREYKVMAALNKTDVPVPTQYLLCMDESIIGKPFYVMEFCQGRIFKDTTLPEVEPSERRALWMALMETLAKIHSVDFRAIGLSDYGRQGGYFERQVKTLTKVSQAQVSVSDKVPAIPGFDKVAAVLNTKKPDDVISICHGDYKPKVIAVIDWEMSTIGHYGADVANCVAAFYIKPLEKHHKYYNVNALMLKGLSPATAASLSLPSRDELLAHYVQCSTATPALNLKSEQAKIWYFLAFYWWKSAVILQGIAARHAAGQASSSHAEMVGSITPFMGELATYAASNWTANENVFSKL